MSQKWIKCVEVVKAIFNFVDCRFEFRVFELFVFLLFSFTLMSTHSFWMKTKVTLQLKRKESKINWIIRHFITFGWRNLRQSKFLPEIAYAQGFGYRIDFKLDSSAKFAQPNVLTHFSCLNCEQFEFQKKKPRPAIKRSNENLLNVTRKSIKFDGVCGNRKSTNVEYI